MQIFFANIFSDEHTLLLSAEESKHCVKVLRHKNGDVIHLIDGKGNFYEAEITDANPQKCIAQIIRKKPPREPKPYRLHLAISPTKNADRIEWMLEKCTEFGVDEFSFIICKRTEKTGVKTERLKKIAESAIKQSMQAMLPVINEAQTFKDFIARHTNTSSKYIAHCIDEDKTELKDAVLKVKPLILIGPEGDFTEEEIKLAIEHKFQPLSLGKNRLRTETAGLYAAAAYKSHYNS
ncbi:MAG TPA: 16S rRNA (uracil(1498)-N(3))-methyltransferase [Bacteroidia bacterium]|nr:16S rRNA (uracil(1498)-N(3))-methyltransferase [Bacteroidia bacterium]